MTLAWAGATPAAAGRVGGHAMMPELTQSALQRAVGDLKPKTSRTKDGETSPSAVPKPPGQQRSTTVCLTYIFLYSPTSAVCRLYRITTRRPRIHKSVLCHIRTRVFIVPKQKNRNYQKSMRAPVCSSNICTVLNTITLTHHCKAAKQNYTRSDRH